MTADYICIEAYETEQAIQHVTTFLGRWRQGEAIGAGERVHATYALGLLAAALAVTTTDDQVDSGTAMLEATIGMGDTLTAIGELAAWYADQCESTPELFRKPFRRTPGPGPHGLPAELAEQRRLATDEEVAEFAASTSAAFQQLATAIRPAVEAAKQAGRMAGRFYPPTYPWAAEPTATPTALYLWYDADDVLIYIGITGDLAGRQNKHSKRSSWAEFAARAEVKRLGSRAEAEDTERRLIRELRPVFNHVHNDTPEARQRLVDYLIQHGRTDLLAPAVARG